MRTVVIVALAAAAVAIVACGPSNDSLTASAAKGIKECDRDSAGDLTGPHAWAIEAQCVRAGNYYSPPNREGEELVYDKEPYDKTKARAAYQLACDIDLTQANLHADDSPEGCAKLVHAKFVTGDRAHDMLLPLCRLANNMVDANCSELAEQKLFTATERREVSTTECMHVTKFVRQSQIDGCQTAFQLASAASDPSALQLREKLVPVLASWCRQGRAKSCYFLRDDALDDPRYAASIAEWTASAEANAEANAADRRDAQKQAEEDAAQQKQIHDQRVKDDRAGNQAAIDALNKGARDLSNALTQNPPVQAPARPGSYPSSPPRAPAANAAAGASPAADQSQNQGDGARRAAAFASCMASIAPQTIPEMGGFGRAYGMLRAAQANAQACVGPWSSRCKSSVQSALPNLAMVASQIRSVVNDKNTALASGDADPPEPRCGLTLNDGPVIDGIPNWCWDPVTSDQASCIRTLDEAVHTLECAEKTARWAYQTKAITDYKAYRAAYAASCRKRAESQ